MGSTNSFLSAVRAKAAWAKVSAPMQVQVTRLFLKPATCPGCDFQPIPVDILPLKPVVEKGVGLMATTARFTCPECKGSYQIERKGTLSGALQRALFAGQQEKHGQPLPQGPSQEDPCAS